MLELLGKVCEGDRIRILVSLFDYFTLLALSRVILENSYVNNCLAIITEGICKSSKHRSWAHIMLQRYANNFLLGPSILSQTLKSTEST